VTYILAVRVLYFLLTFSSEFLVKSGNLEIALFTCVYVRWRGRLKREVKEDTKTNSGMDTTEEKEKRTPQENADGRNTSSHDKKFRTRSIEKQEWRLVSGRRRQLLKIPDT
jgi:hypothetical protein